MAILHQKIKHDPNNFFVIRSLKVDADFFKKIESIPDKMGVSDYIVEYRVYPDSDGRNIKSYEDLKDCDNLFDRSVISIRIDIRSVEGVEPYYGDAPYRITKDADEDAFFISLEINWKNTVVLVVHSTMTVNMDGSNENLKIIKEELEYQTQVISTSAVYTFAVRVFPFSFVPVIWVLVKAFIRVFGLPETYGIPLLGLADIPYKTTFWPTATVVLWVNIVVGFVYMIVHDLFWKIEFSFGDRLKRERKMSELKSNLLWCGLISLVVGIIAGAILNYFTQIFSGFDLIEYLKNN